MGGLGGTPPHEPHVELLEGAGRLPAVLVHVGDVLGQAGGTAVGGGTGLGAALH